MASGPRTPIIVADDDAALREVMSDVLTEAGFFVFTAASGDEVLALVATGVRPCLVICDLLMPGMPAEELVAKLSQNERTRHAPIAIITGSREAQLPEVAHVLRKPFTLAELLDLAAQASARRGPRDSASGI